MFFLLPKIYQLTEYYTMFARKIFFLPNLGCPPRLLRLWLTLLAFFTFPFLQLSICYRSCIFHHCCLLPHFPLLHVISCARDCMSLPRDAT